MHAIADTVKLVADGVIDRKQAREIEARSRETMVTAAINVVLTFGIVAATAGLIFWLGNAASVAVCGGLSFLAGLVVLARGGALYRMFGNAAALIGAGMLLGGGAFELLDTYEDVAPMILFTAGALVAALAATALIRKGLATAFVTGAILLMGAALHLGGLGLLLVQNEVEGVGISLFYLYAAAMIALAGAVTDVRFVTALFILPFAQMLDTGTFYFHAAYAFYSPEPTLSILQMTVLVLLFVWAKNVWVERWARHARVISVMGFIVANLCALVGTLFGDVVGETLWGPGRAPAAGQSWEDYEPLRDAFREMTLTISPDHYAIAWAVLLVLVIFISAHRANRGLFNAAMTFAGIHAYTQLFESFGDEPLAYVVGGLAAIPLAWGMWRLNEWMAGREGAKRGNA